jgi:hypothetical protein
MSSTCTPSPVRADDIDDDTETWMVFVDPETGARASAVLALAYRQHLPLRAKETCFGLMIEGERAIVRGFLNMLRDRYPASLYLKRRPFSIADTRVCARTFNTLGLRRAAEHFRLNNHS